MLPQMCLPVSEIMQTAGEEICSVRPPDDVVIAELEPVGRRMTVKEEHTTDREVASPQDNPIPLRGRRKARWKLKFHHQALPPEYLDHYEASIAQHDAASKAVSGRVRSAPIKKESQLLDATQQMKHLNSSLVKQLGTLMSAESEVISRLKDLKMPDGIRTHETRVGGICDKYLQSNSVVANFLDEEKDFTNKKGHENCSSVIAMQEISVINGTSSAVVNAPGSNTVNFQDLPYMGEITLDNVKPRRGRKPKKADICHLIYKNYGTILQGGPSTQDTDPPSSLSNSAKVKSEVVMLSNLRCKAIDSLKATNSRLKHTDVQNRILSSLLEKRLTAVTQESRVNVSGNTAGSLPLKNSPGSGVAKNTLTHEEPLNLCVKDLNQLKIRLLRRHGNFYEPRATDTLVKSECDSNSDQVSVSPQISLLNSEGVNMKSSSTTSGMLGMIVPNGRLSSTDQTVNNSVANSYVYWPNAGVFITPMALQSQLLYCQKLGSVPMLPITATADTRALAAANNNATMFPDTTISPSVLTATVPLNKQCAGKSFAMNADLNAKMSVMPSELSFPRMKRVASNSNDLSSLGSPTKRKRSAIFIPPMPSKNNANPTTEVSICKFKFTGGAKPSLQEKKMLSVDSGGNFRYYSGTGDKSMRGYEFFPRESLQQTGKSVGSPSEHFLTASAMGSGEKITLQRPTSAETVTKSQSPLQLESPGDGNSLIIFEHPAGSSRHKTELQSSSGAPNMPHLREHGDERGSQFRLRRKRKTRKSLAREKLEKTFKEKGFLIQTQQLESAEGATYCKFRQLRKFTRYLFRSWKDYLPGNVREMSVEAGVSCPQEAELEGDQSCSRPSTPELRSND